MAFKFEGKEMYPNLVFAVLWVISLHSGKACQECAQQTEKSQSNTKSAVSLQVCVYALLVQHLYSAFFQHMVWYGPTSETVLMHRRQKNWLENTDFTELKKITSRIYSSGSNHYLFFTSLKFVAVRFVSSKKITVNTTSVLLRLFYFLLHSTFFRWKVEWDYWWVLWLF